ncbi:MAG: hypothetical protein EXR22_00600 [Flavobacteriaceae bacterium]|nr:hypothetical protein [Flavobacteriaceae bacterium]PHX83663.1 MAG: hypothetical protein CK537_04720 [Flavobacteriales bacterium]
MNQPTAQQILDTLCDAYDTTLDQVLSSLDAESDIPSEVQAAEEVMKMVFSGIINEAFDEGRARTVEMEEDNKFGVLIDEDFLEEIGFELDFDETSEDEEE